MSSSRGSQSGSRWASALIAVPMFTLLTACISIHHLNYDDETAKQSSLGEACVYQSPSEVTVLSRDRNLFSTTRWEGPSAYGLLSADDFLNIIEGEVRSRCTSPASKSAKPLAVTVYGISNVNRVERTGTVLMVFLSALTIGLAPVAGSDDLAVCLDIALPDGSHRYGLSTGNIVDVENIWGGGQETQKGASPRVGVRAASRKREMMSNLVVQALHKAWAIASPALDSGCQKTLDAMLKATD